LLHQDLLNNQICNPFKKKKIPLPFPFNQEELSKIEEILKLQPVQEIPIIKKKRHGRRGKLLGKISRIRM
jgi:hypothetical protein